VTYQFARIDLSKNIDQVTVDWHYITELDSVAISALKDIYRTYCIYKHFASVMPLFDSQFTDTDTDVIGYQDQGQLAAFSLIKRYDQHNALCAQFAWNYRNPKLRLGMESLRTECAIYRERGFKYLYLDQAHLYKQGITGFELLGPL
jgi:hypothetical protein